MKHYKHLTIILVAIFFLATPLAAAPANPAQDTVLPATETYTRAQVDSLINEAFSKNLDTLVELKTWEHYNTYTNDVNNRLTWVAILVAFITATVGFLIPFFLNRQYKEVIDEKLNNAYELIKERQKDSKEIIAKDLESNKKAIADFMEKKMEEIQSTITDHEDKIKAQQTKMETIQERMLGLAKSAKQSSRYAEFSVLLTRALTNKNVPVRIAMLSDIIKEYKNDPFVANAYNCRGNAYSDIEEYDKAISDYTSTIESDPTFASAYNNRGNIYSLKNDYDRAFDDSNNAIKLNPDNGLYYNNRGKLLKKLAEKAKSEGNEEKVKEYNKLAEDDFKKAKELGYTE